MDKCRPNGSTKKEANNRISELQQRDSTVTKENAVWEVICDKDKDNAGGKTKRTPDKIKKRWQDIWRRAKKKKKRTE